MHRILLLLLLVAGLTFGAVVLVPKISALGSPEQADQSKSSGSNDKGDKDAGKNQTDKKKDEKTEKPKITLKTPPSSKTLRSSYHIYQTFNNCGPAALSMTLSYFGIAIGQKELGQELRPYQNARGDNDDKSVSLKELAEKARDFGLTPYHRPNGNIEMLKLFVAHDIPVITRTWLKPTEDVGHYRIVKGYDEAEKKLIQDDSLQGANLRYSYDAFNEIWKKFSYEYLVLVPKDKIEVAEAIIGEDVDEKKAWERVVETASSELEKNHDDVYARFNLSVAFFYLGEYEKAILQFEQVEDKLSFRTLWYQTEPIEAYLAIGNYNRVFAISNNILNGGNRAFSELYLIRGKAFLKMGSKDAAKEEFEKALLYNKNMKAAREALAGLN